MRAVVPVLAAPSQRPRQCHASAVRLPNGLAVRVASGSDWRLLYDEVFVQRCYAQHGVSLRPGDVVLDAGANVGLAALSFARAVAPAGVVVACEPAPPAFDALTANLVAHCGPAATWAGAADVRPRRLALGAEPGEAQMTVYPRASGWSTLRPDASENRRNLGAFVASAPDSALLAAAHPLLRPAAGLLLRLRLPSRLLSAAGSVVATALSAGEYSVSVRVATVSGLLRDEGLAGDVALLKVDVERSELAVLSGVEARDWPRIRQVVVEVHDDGGGGEGGAEEGGGGRLAAVVGLLRTVARFPAVTPVQHAPLRGTNLWTVYAVR